jgi:hypothetical protein
MAGDFRMEARDRLRAGIIERLVAVKDGYSASSEPGAAAARWPK